MHHKCSSKSGSAQVGGEPLDIEGMMVRHEGLIHAFIRRQGAYYHFVKSFLVERRVGVWA